MTMTVTACVTGGGGIGGQKVSKAPSPPRHIETTKGRGEGELGSMGRMAEIRWEGRKVCVCVLAVKIC